VIQLKFKKTFEEAMDEIIIKIDDLEKKVVEQNDKRNKNKLNIKRYT
jgi:hypothetical protein